MKSLARVGVLCAIGMVVALPAGEAPKSDRSPVEVPYRLTVPKHVMIRAKINGKGPFNFILDTGAPALFVTTKVCKNLGIEPDRRGWGTFDRFEIEGGLVLNKIKGRIEDPFQLEGMNGLGLAGAELHGIIGYNILARFRMEIDFTRDKMVWTPLDFEPPPPAGGGNGKSASGGLEIIGSVMKMLGGFIGAKPTPDVIQRGFLGFDVSNGEEYPTVSSVLADSPAAKAGLKVGDAITKFNGRGVSDRGDLLRFTKKVTAGNTVTLAIERAGKAQELKLTSVEGL